MSRARDEWAPIFERALRGYYLDTPTRGIEYSGKKIFNYMVLAHPEDYPEVVAFVDRTKYGENVMSSMLGKFLADLKMNGSWTLSDKNVRVANWRDLGFPWEHDFKAVYHTRPKVMLR